MNGITNFLARFDRSLTITLRGLTLVCFVALLILLSAIVFVRCHPGLDVTAKARCEQGGDNLFSAVNPSDWC